MSFFLLYIILKFLFFYPIINSKKKLVPVNNCRSIGKKDMLYNDLTPVIDVNPETYEVKVDGKLATTDPATKLSMSRLYNLF